MLKADRVLAGLATVLLTTSLAACAGTGGAIATVNGQTISKSDFDNKLEGSPTARGVLQEMVQEALIDGYAKKNNITVGDDEIAKKEDEVKQNFPNGAWDEMLKSRGLTEDAVHTLLRNEIILDKALGKDIKISDAQIKQYFEKNHAAFDKPEQVHARHILVADLATANKIEADLKAGKKFEDEAKQYSIDPGSKDKGGDLGMFRRGQMVPTFDKVAFSSPVGQVSAPVKSPFGYHIIEVLEHQPGAKASLANTSVRITSMLRQQQETPLVQPFMAGLQQNASIQVNDPRFEGLFPSPQPLPSAAATSAAAPAPSASPK